MIAPFQKDLLAEIDAARALLRSFFGGRDIRARCAGGAGSLGVDESKAWRRWEAACQVGCVCSTTEPRSVATERARRATTVSFIPERWPTA